jgi:uncharacterized protein involved in outer membrane biogenesis
MGKGIRISLKLIVVLILMIGFSVAWFDWNKLHDMIVDAVNDRTGQTVAAKGDNRASLICSKLEVRYTQFV